MAAQMAEFKKLFDREVGWPAFDDENHRRSLVGVHTIALNLGLEVPDRYIAMTYAEEMATQPIPTVLEDENENTKLFWTSLVTVAWKFTRPFSYSMKDKDMGFTQKQVLEMEHRVCQCLQWRVYPEDFLTPFPFLEYMIPERLKAIAPSVAVVLLKSKMDVRFRTYRPSVLAASAILAHCSCRLPEGDNKHASDHIFSFEEMRSVKGSITNCCANMKLIVEMIVRSSREGEGRRKETEGEPATTSLIGDAKRQKL